MVWRANEANYNGIVIERGTNIEAITSLTEGNFIYSTGTQVRLCLEKDNYKPKMFSQDFMSPVCLLSLPNGNLVSGEKYSSNLKVWKIDSDKLECLNTIVDNHSYNVNCLLLLDNTTFVSGLYSGHILFRNTNT
jgi:hypothetical protein